MGLINAVLRFNENKNFKFSTFAWSYIRGNILSFVNTDHVIRAKRTKDGFKRADIIEYDSDINNKVDNNDVYNKFVDNIFVSQIIEAEEEPFKEMLKLYMLGYSKVEIAKKQNISQSVICKRFKALKEKYKKYK